MQDKDELRQKIRDAEKEAEVAKKKREFKVNCGFAVAYFIGFWVMDGKPTGIRELVQMVFVSIVLALIHFGVNYIVYDHLFVEKERDQALIDILKKKLDEEETR